MTGAAVADEEVLAACPVCRSPHREELFTARERLFGLPGEFGVVRCRGCELIYLRNRPARHRLASYYPSDRYYAYRPPVAYDLFRNVDLPSRAWYALKRGVLAHRYGYGHLATTRMARRLGRLPLPRPLRTRATFGLEVLLHRYVPGGSLLEVGSGSGMYLDLMRALGWERVVGVDLSSAAVELARTLPGVEAYEGDLAGAGLAAASFDAASVAHTLEHLPDPVAALRELHRLLRPGARLAVVVPNGDSLLFRRLRERWYQLDAPRHLVLFNRASLQEVLARGGFEVEALTCSARLAVTVVELGEAVARGEPIDGSAALPATVRARARIAAARERIGCLAGRWSGEELLAVAVRR